MLANLSTLQTIKYPPNNASKKVSDYPNETRRQAISAFVACLKRLAAPGAINFFNIGDSQHILVQCDYPIYAKQPIIIIENGCLKIFKINN